jgi:hypothetical protein
MTESDEQASHDQVPKACHQCPPRPPTPGIAPFLGRPATLHHQGLGAQRQADTDPDARDDEQDQPPMVVSPTSTLTSRLRLQAADRAACSEP